VALSAAQFALLIEAWIGAARWHLRRLGCPSRCSEELEKTAHFAWAQVAILVWKTMSCGELDIPDSPDAVKALLAAMQAKLAASEQTLAVERAAHQETRQQLTAAENAIKLTTLQIEKLKAQLARLRRMKFGQSSERLLLLADQLELSRRIWRPRRRMPPAW
jgi:septal ring factor EnvC (AmiA/AmiB activator)